MVRGWWYDLSNQAVGLILQSHDLCVYAIQKGTALQLRKNKNNTGLCCLHNTHEKLYTAQYDHLQWFIIFP